MPDIAPTKPLVAPKRPDSPSAPERTSKQKTDSKKADSKKRSSQEPPRDESKTAPRNWGFEEVRSVMTDKKQRERRLRLAQQKREAEEAEKARGPTRPSLGEKCYDCHPKPKLPALDPESFPVIVGDEEVAKEVAGRFDAATKDRSPLARGGMADGWARKMAAEGGSGEKFSRSFRMEEANRLREAASKTGTSRVLKNNLNDAADHLVMRPLSNEQTGMLDELEKTDTAQISRRDAKAAMALVRDHKPAGDLGPAPEGLFLDDAGVEKLFDPTRYMYDAKEALRPPELQKSVKCYD